MLSFTFVCYSKFLTKFTHKVTNIAILSTRRFLYICFMLVLVYRNYSFSIYLKLLTIFA